MRRHFGDELRRAFKSHTSAYQRCVGVLNVVHLEIKNRAWMIELRFLRNAEHQPDTAAIEERHVSRRKEMLHSQRVAIEFQSPLKVMNIDRDLANFVQGKSWL